MIAHQKTTIGLLKSPQLLLPQKLQQVWLLIPVSEAGCQALTPNFNSIGK